MKKQKIGRQFGRPKSQRKALLNSLARSLFIHSRIETTEAKAKELKRYAEKFITKSKKTDLATIKSLNESFDRPTVIKLVDTIGPKYKDRKGGYTRIIKKGPRMSDGAKIAIIELV